jgi:hypothetical protein
MLDFILMIPHICGALMSFFLILILFHAKDKAIGLLKLGLFADKIHLRQFQLLPQYQGLGIGNRL